MVTPSLSQEATTLVLAPRPLGVTPPRLAAEAMAPPKTSIPAATAVRVRFISVAPSRSLASARDEDGSGRDGLTGEADGQRLRRAGDGGAGGGGRDRAVGVLQRHLDVLTETVGVDAADR